MTDKFGVILADPPWRYVVYNRDTGLGRSAEAHYPTMPTQDIALLDVQSVVTQDCALFMWATWPTIEQAFALGKTWDFKFKTVAFVWAKTNKKTPGKFAVVADDANWFCGMGFWTRANTEPCLLFTKGQPKRLAKNVRQLIVAPVREHSRKPDEQYERVERLVGGPYLELFARRKREGWSSWGNEIENDVALRQRDD